MSECLELMRKLIEYRQQKALHHQLMKIGERSMLGIDAIVMLYHCAKVSGGDILEVGAYIGGATIAVAMGVRDSGAGRKIISIEREVSVQSAHYKEILLLFRPASLRKVHGSVAIETKR